MDDEQNDDPDRPYECGVCGERFESEDELERHVHDVGLVD